MAPWTAIKNVLPQCGSITSSYLDPDPAAASCSEFHISCQELFTLPTVIACILTLQEGIRYIYCKAYSHKSLMEICAYFLDIYLHH